MIGTLGVVSDSGVVSASDRVFAISRTGRMA
jgi:hypothetical protein